jgi:hypothetical protein
VDARGSCLWLEVGGGSSVAELRHPWQGWNSDGDLDLAGARGLQAEAGLEGPWEVVAGGAPGVVADGVGAGGGSGRATGRPGGVAGQRELPERDEQRERARQQCDELDGSLAVVAERSAACARRREPEAGVVPRGRTCVSGVDGPVVGHGAQSGPDGVTELRVWRAEGLRKCAECVEGSERRDAGFR